MCFCCCICCVKTCSFSHTAKFHTSNTGPLKNSAQVEVGCRHKIICWSGFCCSRMLVITMNNKNIKIQKIKNKYNLTRPLVYSWVLDKDFAVCTGHVFTPSCWYFECIKLMHSTLPSFDNLIFLFFFLIIHYVVMP